MVMIRPDRDGFVGEEEINNDGNDGIIWTRDKYTYDNIVSCCNYESMFEMARKSVTIREFHQSVFTSIFEEGVFSCSYSDLFRGLITIGGISLCESYNMRSDAACDSAKIILSKEIKAVSKTMDKMNKIIGMMNKIDTKDSDMVFGILAKYSSSKLVKAVCSYYFNHIFDTQQNTKNHISNGAIARCKSLLKTKITLSDINTKKMSNSTKTSVYLTRESLKIVDAIKKNLCEKELISEVLRLCFIQGLYLVSDIIVSGKINQDEVLAVKAFKEIEDLYINRVARDIKG